MKYSLTLIVVLLLSVIAQAQNVVPYEYQIDSECTNYVTVTNTIADTLYVRVAIDDVWQPGAYYMYQGESLTFDVPEGQRFTLSVSDYLSGSDDTDIAHGLDMGTCTDDTAEPTPEPTLSPDDPRIQELAERARQMMMSLTGK